ncbi:RGS-domain-containing protein [Venustampulla echinocandica]|uniref:RGS-domain-containing protein n=1 Tax=Venustampulla echinocandica TaxID=2656787 RepID=A0A370TFK1_9HELO|nr:RGS-domain-containing protein [Venustampulla echinocandica]RDL33677.1 RGS-domain-containing protein [Venustampulla echinocandica]
MALSQPTAAPTSTPATPTASTTTLITAPTTTAATTAATTRSSSTAVVPIIPTSTRPAPTIPVPVPVPDSSNPDPIPIPIPILLSHPPSQLQQHLPQPQPHPPTQPPQIASPLLSPVAPIPPAPAQEVVPDTTEPPSRVLVPSSNSASNKNNNNKSNRESSPYRHRQFALSTSAVKTARKVPVGIFTFGYSPLKKPSDQSLRHRTSSNSLHLSARSLPASISNSLLARANNISAGPESIEPREALELDSAPSISNPANIASLASAPPKTLSRRRSLLETDPPSQAYSDTAADAPPPIAFIPVANPNKMHQTSSRLLRMTSDERPFTRDFKDLFSTLVVSLPLAPHRVRLTRVEHSFLSEEAINNLGSLKFSQSNRMPDPKDSSRIVTTTTTTTFSMAREMARSVCQRFLDARFIESADGKQAREFTLKGSVWQLTPKGIHVLERFCSRNGIQQRHVTELVGSSRNTMQLVILERDQATDKLSADRSTTEVIFRRFVGQNGPNVKSTLSSADSDSLSEYKDGLSGVKMASERKIGSPQRTVLQTFTGKAAADWLMDCCTTVDRRETVEIATNFLEQGLIWCVQSDRLYLAQSNQQEKDAKFQPAKNAIYQLTQKGKDVVSMTSRERASDGGVSRDSNTQKLDKILNDAALRLLFRENLRDTHCEENLSFYLDVDEFLRSCRAAIKAGSPSRAAGSKSPSLDSVKETMASAYGIYNAFLAPGSPCELNIDHLLRNQLATRMTKAVGQDSAMIDSLREVTKLFEEAQVSVFKLMASDSVPKFMKSPKYEQTLKNYDFDSIPARFNHVNMPERTMSRSNR